MGFVVVIDVGVISILLLVDEAVFVGGLGVVANGSVGSNCVAATAVASIVFGNSIVSLLVQGGLGNMYWSWWNLSDGEVLFPRKERKKLN